LNRKTHLYEYHVKNAKMTEFAGFEMPLWYDGIIIEHLAVREGVGIFDVTHMGRALIEGVDAEDFLNYILSRDISGMKVIQGRYSLMLNEKGGIIDDLTIFKLDENKYLLVYNASNREKDLKWINKNSKCYSVSITDISDETPMFAIQGPKAIPTLNKLFNIDLDKVKRYWGVWANFNNKKILLTRSGYTGEDGYEVYLWDTPLSEWRDALELWEAILEAGSEYSIKPCGLGARDTLRLEAGMCLYDHDINEETNPFEARLDFTVSLSKENFIGKKALIKIKESGVKRIRVGIKLSEKGIPREGYKILSKNRKEIGIVTSGTFSPLLKIGIAMGYVQIEYSEEGSEVYIDIRGDLKKGIIVTPPFYDTSRYGWKRSQ